VPRVHVVAHTHWDREWYHSAARFQVRLSRLIGQLLPRLENRPDWSSFLLDGQAVTLDDYLAVRPGDAAALARLLAAGRLECGPWFVLPDEILVSAEALVRNLFTGARTVRRLGGTPMVVGYSPDAFGHTGALPSILRGFGIGTAVVWRGFGGEPGQEGDLYRWRSADGAEVLMIHLPRPGYENGANLPADEVAARERWAVLAAMLAPRSRTDEWLVLAGADHHAPAPDLPEAVDALRRVSGADVRLGTLQAYADAVVADVARRNLELPLVEGELVDGRRHAWALTGTYASRLILKRWNALCQRTLERVVEPLGSLALAWRGADLREEIWSAWRELLLNHPHDSICGTSADEVHREMLARFRRCADAAQETAARALDLVTGRDADAARVAPRATWRPALVVFNPAPRRVDGVVEAEIALFRADVKVGQQGPRAAPPVPAGAPFVLRDGERPVACQELGRRAGYDLTEAPQYYPDCDAVEWVRVAMDARGLPPLGVRTFTVEAGAAAPPREPAEQDVQVRAASLENEHLFVRVDDDGALEIVDGASGAHYSAGALDDVEDQGDSYTASPRGVPSRLPPDAVAVEVVHAGPLRGTLLVRRRFDARDLDVAMRVTLDAGARSVVLEFEGVNRRPDHRLRVLVPLGVLVHREVADGHFGPVPRGGARRRELRPGDLEAAPPTAAMQRYVVVQGNRRGVAVLADGLPEYEITPAHSIAVTLLRAFGELSKPDLPERPGHAGWPTPTPDAQCLGPFAARLAVTPCPPERPLEVLEAEAERFLAAPYARMVRATLVPAAPVAGPELSGAGLVFSAMKPAEDGRGVILRCYNATDRVAEGAWRVPWPTASATRCRLDETDEAPLAVEQGRIAIAASPRQVVSVRVCPPVRP